MEDSATLAHRISDLVTTRHFRYTNERDIQNALENLLTNEGMDAQREVHLAPRDRIDLLVENVGIEVKIGGSDITAFAQCQRYAHSDRIDHLILVTTRVSHTTLPETVAGKPLTVTLIRSAL